MISAIWFARNNKQARGGDDPVFAWRESGIQNELEQQLAYSFSRRAPEVIGNEYLVLGTLDSKDWKEGLAQPADIRETLDRHHPFKDALEVHTSGGWQPIDPPPARDRKR